MKLSIVLSTQPASFSALAYKGELETNILKIANLGYDGVELAVRDPRLLDSQYLSRLLSEHNLEVPAVGTGQAYGEEELSFTHPEEKLRRQAVERIKAQIDFASHFKAQVIIGLIRGRVEDGVSREKAEHWLFEALSECANYASSVGVKLAMEPINRYETNLIVTVAEGLHLIERIGSESLGLLMDTFHMNIEEPSLEASIRAAGDKIFHCHVADSNRWYPGAGHVDFRRIVEVLGETGYDGYLSAEILPRPSPDVCAEQAIANMRSILKQVAKA
ncbi:MAG: 5-keto-L-gluconate epimerase [bacterium]